VGHHPEQRHQGRCGPQPNASIAGENPPLCGCDPGAARAAGSRPPGRLVSGDLDGRQGTAPVHFARVSSTATVSAQPRVARAAAVSVRNVSKAFRLPHQQYHTLKERVLHPFRSTTFDVLQAVDDVSIEIGDGEFFGIVGRNGSGKSTLLKCLAGIYDIDSGELEVRGRLSPFIELGVGFNMDLTARDNVLINAIMLGLSRRQARDRFDAIIDFAELHEFLDLKLKNYSSGMLVRLAFSVAIQVDAEILLIDEVLAVGDAGFQQKCFDEFQRLKKERKTIVFVTHDMSAVQRFCDRAMLLERGRLVQLGDPATVSRSYYELAFGRTVHELADEEQARGPRPVEIQAAWFEDPEGTHIESVAHGDPCCLAMEVSFHESLENPIFGVTLRNELGHTVFATTSALEHGPTGRFSAGENVVVRLRFETWLTAARYSATPSIARDGPGNDALDLREDLAWLLIHGGHFTGGVTNLPHGFEVERS
jgi:ABC-type polysaccharide/polyol phosphate transport system ATPase subunit